MASNERTRSATLVVVDRDGVVRGVHGPITVALPWWQEVGPVIDAVPGITVLRLLSATPQGDQPMGGAVTYLVEATEESLARFGAGSLPPLKSWSGSLDHHRLRHPWAEPGGPAADLAWVDSIVSISGEPRQHRTWNLSAVWSIPTGSGTVWLKCVPPFMAHEIAVLEHLDGLHVPHLIAADRHRFLMTELPGEDGYDADESEQQQMVRALVDLQVGSVEQVDQLVRAGVPDLRGDRLVRELTALLDRVADDRTDLTELRRQLPQRIAAADDCGVPNTLVHGDPHGGNCRRGVTPAVWFDWGDSFIGNPLLDLAGLHRMSRTTVASWLEMLAEVFPSSNPSLAWRHLEPVAMLRMAWVYQRFLDNIEPSEQIYHRDDVAQILDSLEALMAAY